MKTSFKLQFTFSQRGLHCSIPSLDFFLSYEKINTLENLHENLTRKKCPYSEFFLLAFSRIWIEYGEIQSIPPYSVRMRARKNPNTNRFEAVYLEH